MKHITLAALGLVCASAIGAQAATLDGETVNITRNFNVSSSSGSVDYGDFVVSDPVELSADGFMDIDVDATSVTFTQINGNGFYTPGGVNAFVISDVLGAFGNFTSLTLVSDGLGLTTSFTADTLVFDFGSAFATSAPPTTGTQAVFNFTVADAVPAVPLPAGGVLLLSGFAVAAAAGRRRKRRG